MSNLANWIGGWHDNWPRLRQAVQTTVAACLAYAAAELVNAPQGFWAVMTAILVTQANVGASLGLAVDRLLGSLLGVIVGGAVALAIADHQSWKYLALALTVLVLAFFSARRPPFRIACVTAAIVILGDPRFGPPLSSAGYRMLEVTIGAGISVLTSLMLFPSRAGPEFAEHVERMLPMLFQMMAEALACALGKPRDEKAIAEAGLKIRAAFAAGDDLAKETRLEVAGFLADHPTPTPCCAPCAASGIPISCCCARSPSRCRPAPSESCGQTWRGCARLSRRCPLDTRKQIAATRRPISHRS